MLFCDHKISIVIKPLTTAYVVRGFCWELYYFLNSTIVTTSSRKRNESMTEQENLLINLENAIAEVSQQLGSEEVEFVLMKYGATCIDDLDPSDYSSVFSELDALLNN